MNFFNLFVNNRNLLDGAFASMSARRSVKSRKTRARPTAVYHHPNAGSELEEITVLKCYSSCGGTHMYVTVCLIP